MQVGDTVKWTTRDDVVTGILMAFDGKRYTISPGNCTMEFPVGDGKVELVEPLLVQQVGRVMRPYQVAAIEAIKAMPTITMEVCGVTKKQRAEGIYTCMQGRGASRTDIIHEFMATLGMTMAGASTYYANCKSALTPRAH